jgi:hypothetical protein
MEAIVVVPAPQAAPLGELTLTMQSQDARYTKLLRLHRLKADLRRIRAEQEALEAELFGPTACIR